MPLTDDDLRALQASSFAEDVPIQYDKMRGWTEAQATAFFESGGVERPYVPCPAAKEMPSSQQQRPPLSQQWRTPWQGQL